MTVENNPKRLTRRDFIRGTVGATLAVSVLGVPWAKGSEAVGPASFRVRLIDCLYNLDEETLETGARIQ